MRRHEILAALLLSMVILIAIAKLPQELVPTHRETIEGTLAPSTKTITIKPYQTTQKVLERTRSISTEHPELAHGSNLVPNSGFETVVRSNDEFSDIYGNRPFPWGFEVLSGNPIRISNSSVAHSGKFSVEISGVSSEDAVLFAIPEYALKPKISPGRLYRLEVWVKFENLDGPGVRLIQQFFNRSYSAPAHRIFGPWHRGSSNWTKLILDAKTVDIDNRVGNPVIELWGNGTLWIDDLSFYEVFESQPTRMNSFSWPIFPLILILSSARSPPTWKRSFLRLSHPRRGFRSL
jgi:hypothetical protein